MSIEISPELVPFVQSLIASGEYHSEVEVVDAALRALVSRREEVERLRAELAPALAELGRGEGHDVDAATLEAFFEEIIRESQHDTP